jgi:hypothetical protein
MAPDTWNVEPASRRMTNCEGLGEVIFAFPLLLRSCSLFVPEEAEGDGGEGSDADGE